MSSGKKGTDIATHGRVNLYKFDLPVRHAEE